MGDEVQSEGAAGESVAGQRIVKPVAFWWGVWVLGVGLAGIVCVHVFGRGVFSVLPGCVVHDMTGLHCMGCGMTRALFALAKGQVLTAFGYNLLLPVLVAWVVLWAGDNVAAGLTGRHWLRFRLHWVAIVLIVMGGLAFMVLRNLADSPFAWMAP